MGSNEREPRALRCVIAMRYVRPAQCDLHLSCVPPFNIHEEDRSEKQLSEEEIKKKAQRGAREEKRKTSCQDPHYPL
ncbi:unnamed protein product [Pleuronectes platessa]|uniref:Uncharacterized protein n=1 Tax=Pleuronectes platessa TaxID=8262 RepID=A0A9N7VGM4_PLEPL|nr:unnamed protein product [Pleuronectes platessa]